MRSRFGFSALAVAACALSGCHQAGVADKGAATRADPASVAAPAADAAPYDTSLPLSEFMEHVMTYAANGIWKWQGIVLDKAGEHSLYPKSNEDWEDAESGARTLAETTNILLIPGRRIADAGWDDAAIKVRKLALQAAEAAEKHDKAAFVTAGSALDQACDACHVRYDPNFKDAPQ